MTPHPANDFADELRRKLARAEERLMRSESRAEAEGNAILVSHYARMLRDLLDGRSV